ncbi:MAG: prolipoprotein diacylglyceryl transferase [Eubacteriales bacterium]|nr:prolipoprotein diacylglyceryl transferase [Eubacteriales bacterium]
MNESFTIFGLTGYWYGLIACAGALCAIALMGVLGYRRRLPAGVARMYGLIAIPVSLLCARLLYCLVNLSYFTETLGQPLLMLRFWDGGYSMTGMLCGAVLAALPTARVMRVRFGDLLDCAAAPLAGLIACLRFAEGYTQLGVGRYVQESALTQSAPILFVQSRLGNSMLSSLAVYRYEALAAGLILCVMLWLFLSSRGSRKGDLGLIFFALYGASQVVLESLRDDGHMLWGFVRAAQLFSALMPMLALAVFGGRYAHIRGARWQVTLAWLLVPVAAALVVLMVAPVNHVLDLSGHIGLGCAGVALCGVYMGFFLRRKGGDARLTLSWLATVLALCGVILIEFNIDGSADVLRDYLLMTACAGVLFAAPALMWRTLRRGVYGEEHFVVTADG